MCYLFIHQLHRHVIDLYEAQLSTNHQSSHINIVKQ